MRVDFILKKKSDYEGALEEREGGPFPRKPYPAMLHFAFCF